MQGISTVDCAKAIAAAACYSGDAWDLVLDKSKVTKALPIFVVLTVAATGSEMDCGSVISNPETKDKYDFDSPWMRPSCAFMDPTHTFTVPKKQTAAGTVDIMSHVLEAYFSRAQGFMQDRIAEALLKTCIVNGNIALDNPTDYDARANLMWASSWAINGLTSCGKGQAWSVHQIEHMCENDDLQKREALLKEVEFNCRIGQKIGAKALVINMPKNSFESGKPYEKEPEQILSDSTAILNCLCELAQKYGIGIGVEVIGSKRSSIRTVRQVNSLFKTVNYPNLGYVLDPYNLFTYDKTLTFDSILEADPTRIFAAHINQSEEDLPIHLLCKENRSLCDRGVMNIDRYMKNLQTIGYDGPVSIEVFPKDYWEDDAEWIVSECYKTTKAFMEKNGFIDTVC